MISDTALPAVWDAQNCKRNRSYLIIKIKETPSFPDKKQTFKALIMNCRHTRYPQYLLRNWP